MLNFCRGSRHFRRFMVRRLNVLAARHVARAMRRCVERITAAAPLGGLVGVFVRPHLATGESQPGSGAKDAEQSHGLHGSELIRY